MTNEKSIMDNQKEVVKCFVIQPFGIRKNEDSIIDNDRIYEKIKHIEIMLPTIKIVVERANTQSVKKENLHAHVVQCIKESDFCISDFSGDNPNVLYETGYARGIGKEVIVISSNRKDIPSDLKELLTVLYQPDNIEHLASDLYPHLDRIISSVRERNLNEKDLIRFFSKRDDQYIRTQIAQSKENIDILQTNLSSIQASYISEILKAMKQNDKLKLRILTLNPQSIFVNFRGQQLKYGDNIDLYRGELDANLKTVHFQLLEFKDRAEIRLYDDFPSQLFFKFDNEVLFCVVSATQRSRNNCAFSVKSENKGVKDSIIDHFDYLWDKKSNNLSIIPEK